MTETSRTGERDIARRMNDLATLKEAAGLAQEAALRLQEIIGQDMEIEAKHRDTQYAEVQLELSRLRRRTRPLWKKLLRKD